MSAGPFYFGPAERRLFGWLHPAAGPEPPRLAVVICNPFGFEAVCAHRALRHLAEACARAGFPTLRFDYDGTGDSAGDDGDLDRVGPWVASIHAAMDCVRARTGVTQVCLVGLRLGATLAAVAGATRSDCAALIALNPVLTPGLYLRELQLMHAWGPGGAPDGAAPGPLDLEAAGFVLGAATVAALTALDLTRPGPAPAPRVLVLEREQGGRSERWVDPLRPLGVDAEVQRLPGFVEMSVDPHRTQVPARIIEATVAWLTRVRASLADTGAPGPAEAGTVASESTQPGGVVERAIFVDPARTRFGIIAHAPAAPRTGRAILLLNAGAQHRIGPSRLWVHLSRRWAARGLVALRLDLSGIGDSATRAGEAENEVYSPAGVADIAEAIAYLRREWGVTRVQLVGLCGSAYQGFKAAVAGVALDGAVLFNQQVFFWHPAGEAEPVSSTRALSEVRRLRRALGKVASWSKLLRGEVHVRAAALSLRKRVVDVAANVRRHAARVLGLPVKDDLAAELRAAAANRIPLRFVFSMGEPGEQLLTELAGPVVEDLVARGAVHIDHLEGTDHTFTAARARRVVVERLDGWLGVQ